MVDNESGRKFSFFLKWSDHQWKKITKTIIIVVDDNYHRHLMDHLHWRSLLAKLSGTVTHDSQMIVLALATLDGATQIGSFLFFCRTVQGGQGKYSHMST